MRHDTSEERKKERTDGRTERGTEREQKEKMNKKTTKERKNDWCVFGAGQWWVAVAQVVERVGRLDPRRGVHEGDDSARPLQARLVVDCMADCRWECVYERVFVRHYCNVL